MKPASVFVFTLLVLTACGTPASNDVVLEIMDAAKETVGKPVALKTSASLKSASLDDASRVWFVYGWQEANGALCKGKAPSDWPDVAAFDYVGAMTDLKQNKAYNLRICATQLTNPKRIGAIGFIVSSQKIEPIVP